MIDPEFIWPDDRYELLSRLSCGTWIQKQWLLEDLGWEITRLDAAIMGIRDLEITVRVSTKQNAILLSRRSKSIALVAIRGYEERL